MSTTSRPRTGLAVLAVGLLAAGTLLSGCSVSDERPRPGAAAQVGDVRITTDTVDGTVTDACAYFKSLGNDPFPRSVALQQFVRSLVEESAVEQLMDETGATLDGNDNYQSDLSSLGTQLDALPDKYRDAVGSLSRAALVISYGTYAIGDAELTSAGVVPGSTAEVTERGQTALADWLRDHDVSINPIYQLAIVDGSVVVDGEGTSVAQTAFAKAGLLDVLSEDEKVIAALNDQVGAMTALLPTDQLCGG